MMAQASGLPPMAAVMLSTDFWPAACSLSLLFWLVRRAYRQFLTLHDGSPPVHNLNHRSLMRCWESAFKTLVPDDPDCGLGPAITVDGFLQSRTLLLEPSAVAAAYRLSSTTPSNVPFRHHLNRVFGISSAALDDQTTLDRLQHIQRVRVSAKSALETTLRAYAVSLERQIAAFGVRKFQRQTSSSAIRFDTSLCRLVQIASMVSFFGPSFPADDLKKPLITLSEAIADLASTPLALQGWVLPEICKAREELVGLIEGWLDLTPSEMEASALVSQLRLTAQGAGWSKSDLSRLLLAFIFTLSSNAPGTLAWAMLHIVQAGAELVEPLRGEACRLFSSDDDEDGGINVLAASGDASHAMPLTTDVILETMRLYTVSNAYRHVEADTFLTVSSSRSTPPRIPLKPHRPKSSRSVSFTSSSAPPTPPSRPNDLGRSRSSSASSLHSTASLPSSMKGSRRTPSPSPTPPRRQQRHPILLKADTMVVLCGRGAQLSKEVWGPDANVWKPSRWHDDHVGEYFWPWDSPAFTCDVRHLVMAQLRIAIALLLRNFDVHFPPHENPAFDRPTWANEHIYLKTGAGQDDDEVLLRGFSPGYKRTGAGNGTLRMNGGVEAVVSRRKW